MDKLFAASLLAADLKDAVVFTDGLDKLLALIDSQCDRFFKIDILAGLAGGDSDNGMLVVGGCDHDSIDIRAGEEVIIILIDIDLDLLFSLSLVVVGYPPDKAVSLYVIDVTSGDDADIIHRDEAVEKIHRLLSEADEAKIHLGKGRGLFRGLRGCCRKDCSRDHGSGDAQSGRLQKVSSLHSVMWFIDNIPIPDRDRIRAVSLYHIWTDP